MQRRGALIVIEGLDRTGKSTQAKLLVESLKKKNINAEYNNFPNRNTEIGQVINRFLSSQSDLSDEAIHLLFSANRWERANTIIRTLEAGITLVVDRYCYSGVAFSSAKGLNMDWCKSTDSGLPLPDKVFFLNLPIEQSIQRKGFGSERYEIVDFQKKVSEMYANLKEEHWDVLDANRSKDSIHEELLEKTLKIVENVKQKPIGKLWMNFI